MLCCSISPSLLYTIFSITFHFEWMCKKIGKEDWRNLLNLSTTYFSKTFVLMSFQFSIQPPNITGIMDEGWFNNYVMQWLHPLVWKKIMVGLCLCWDRGGWWSKRLCIMVFLNIACQDAFAAKAVIGDRYCNFAFFFLKIPLRAP